MQTNTRPHTSRRIKQALALQVAFFTLIIHSHFLVRSSTCTAAESGTNRRITLTTYNVENMLDVFDDPYTKDESIVVKPREAYKQIAAIIRKINPDIMAFQELENEAVLKAMTRNWLSDRGYNYIAVGKTNSNRGINLGIISKIPIHSVTSYRFKTLRLPGHDKTWRFARDLMHVQLDITKSKRLHLFSVHLKSQNTVEKSDPKGAKWRLAEASKAKQIITNILAKDSDALIALVGDINDMPKSPVLNELLAPVQMQPTLKPELVLINPHAHLLEKDRITYLKKPYRTTIDYTLISPTLRKLLVEGSPTVEKDETLLGGSDHAPVSLQFLLPIPSIQVQTK